MRPPGEFPRTGLVYVIGASGLAREMRQLVLATSSDQRVTVLLIDAGEEASVEEGSTAVLGIGRPGPRAAAFERLATRLAFPSLVHPRADVGDTTTVGEGSVVTSGVVTTTDVEIGRGVLLNLNCTVGHDCRVGDFCVVNPGAAISGGVVIEPEVLVGTKACILEGRRIGRGATIGAGAVVTKDVPPGTVVAGVPAREL